MAGRTQVFRKGLDLADAARIYEPSHIGGMRLPGAVNQDLLQQLKKEVRGIEETMRRSPSVEGKVRQKLFTVYIGTIDSGPSSIKMQVPEAIDTLAENYTQRIYNAIGQRAGFPAIDVVNSIGIHRYPANDGGIRFHRDYLKDMNLIGIFSIEGEARFSLAFTRNGRGKQAFTVAPGDLVLMRANREDYENPDGTRPFHMIQTLGEDRYSIVFRYRHSEEY